MKLKKLLFITLTTVFLLLVAATISFYHNWFGHYPVLIKTNFAHLPGWENDNHDQALETLRKSCLIIAKKDPKKQFSNSLPQGGTVLAWQKICLAADQVDKSDKDGARKFFESWFIPYSIYDNFKNKGLFTGYYLPVLKCITDQDKQNAALSFGGGIEKQVACYLSDHSDNCESNNYSLIDNLADIFKYSRYTVPIYAIPDDWVKVDLGIFDENLKGRMLTGRIKNHTLDRYPTSAAIRQGAIVNKAKVLAWCDSEIDVAFAHIQGSAIVQLPDQKQFLIGYKDSNGRSYTSILKVLIKNNELTSQNSSMQDIRAWFMRHPEKVDNILNQNASYVFFGILNSKVPLGVEQIPLTPGRSLAVDKKYIPLLAPIWLDTVIPEAGSPPFQHLLIAQDIGGSIKGIVRGDVYWGSGDRAEFIAGHMKSRGKYWVLLPKHHAK